MAEVTAGRAPLVGEAPALPVVLPRAPSATVVWSRALVAAWILLALFSADLLALLLMDFWLFESLGYESVFWTNFRMGAALFAVSAGSVTLAATVPALVHGLSSRARRHFLQLGAILGILAGFWAAGKHVEFLAFFGGLAFGETDPVFGLDIGFYVFKLPAIETALRAAWILLSFALVCGVVTAYLARPGRAAPGQSSRLLYVIGTVASPYTRIVLAILAVVLALRAWLFRYGIPTWDNGSSSIPNGAEFIDVTGFFSRVNTFTVDALAILFGLGALAIRLGSFHRAATREPHLWERIKISALLIALMPGVVIAFAFQGMFALRNQTKVTPNEPVIQLPFIKRHIDFTNKGYATDQIETIPFVPKGPDDPLPDIEALLSHPTIRNAQLWPGYVSSLEELIDPQHTERVLLAAAEDGWDKEDAIIYGPTLDVFKQQEKLRPYYDFIDIDNVRYKIRGEDRLFVSAVREVPLVEPQPWLAWWGQRFVLFTHGHGMVMAEVDEQDSAGGPVFASRSIPLKAAYPQFRLENEAVYYGEGSGSMAYTNAEGIDELDFPTDQGRATVRFPEDVEAGVNMDSFLKRLVFGWKSRQTLDILFSELITPDTRVHYYRTPLERAERMAPFLYFDTDPYAVAADGGIHWMVNGITTTDRYPYSRREKLGDKSDNRSPTTRPTRRVNYIRDSVKVSVNAFTGGVRFFKWADEPVANTWASIYPDLFADKAEMSEEIREQVQYPVQFFHSQFDDLYIFYHMLDPLEFFNQEDLWDDGDEVIGSILDEGEAITFSIEPYYWIAEPGGDLPPSEEKTQFALSMVFTPENALNIRSIATVYMNGADYGKQSVLQVPKGQFFPGPEQADAAIDQDAFISQQIALWNRQGLVVIRGHTTPLVVDGEVIYVEPLFIKSKQNPAPQMKRVIVVFRGRATLGETLEEALRFALDPPPRFPVRPGPELGGEPGFLPTEGQGFQEAPRSGGFTSERPRDPNQQPSSP
jgi:uncharacterized membrane protein (UPF0182 family)